MHVNRIHLRITIMNVVFCSTSREHVIFQLKNGSTLKVALNFSSRMFVSERQREATLEARGSRWVTRSSGRAGSACLSPSSRETRETSGLCSPLTVSPGTRIMM